MFNYYKAEFEYFVQSKRNTRTGTIIEKYIGYYNINNYNINNYITIEYYMIDTGEEIVHVKCSDLIRIIN